MTGPPSGRGLRLAVITTGPSAVLGSLLDGRHTVAAIVQNAPARRGAGAPSPLRRFARFVSSGGRARAASLRTVAERHGAAFYLMDRGCDRAFYDWVRELRPDLIVVCAMLQLLKKKIFTIPPLGAINLHPSHLPAYRGPDPFYWMAHDMTSDGGVTVHFIDDGADTGDLVFQEAFPIAPGATRAEVVCSAMGEVGPRLLQRALDALAAGDYPRIPQPRDSPTPYARRVDRDEHLRLLDWDGLSLVHAWHYLRGTEPVWQALGAPPGWRRGFRWRVGRCVPGPGGRGRAGTVDRDGGGFFVHHGGGKIRLHVDYALKPLARRLLAGRF